MKRSSRQPAEARQCPLVIALPDANGGIDNAWLKQLRDSLPGHEVLTAGKRLKGVEAIQAAKGPWWQWISRLPAKRADGGVLVITSGLELPKFSWQRLAGILQEPDCPPLITFPGNHQDTVNPAAGLSGLKSAQAIDSFIHASGRFAFTAVLDRPRDIALIAPGQVKEASRQAARGKAWLYDGLWICDSGRPLNAGQLDQPDKRAVLGRLRRGLQKFSSSNNPELLPYFGESKPVALHVAHSWGGGISRWIADFIAADKQRDHLVLASSGHPDRTTHGESLHLYASSPDRNQIREWTLAPSINSTDTEHTQYADILGKLIERYGISQIIVSSLIGHSLDVFETGISLMQVLHDYYPAWPVLDRDPLAYIDAAGRTQLQRAIDQRGAQFIFTERDSQFWRHLTDQWLDRVSKAEAALVSPTQHVIERWQRLSRKSLDRVNLIPHGFSGWPEKPEPIEARPLDDGRLNLVLVGRITGGKGSTLLQASIGKLRKFARITLLGCGREGMNFFGQPGIDVILDYEHEQLPRHLAAIAPQAALFLSTVPETWNYVLSEVRSLRIVPIATDLGSFRERIVHNQNGLLFAPESDALISTIKDLYKNPEHIDALRENLPEELDIEQAISGYASLMDGNLPVLRRCRKSGNITLQHSLGEAELSDRIMQIEFLEEAQGRLREDLRERTDWARKLEGLTNQRTKWARKLDKELKKRTQWARRYEKLSAERTEWAEKLDKELHELREERKQLNDELQKRAEWARHYEKLSAERTEWARSLETDVQSLRDRLKEYEDYMLEQAEKHQHQIAELQSNLAGKEQELSDRESRIQELQASVQEQSDLIEERTAWAWKLDRELAMANERMDRLDSELQTVFNSHSWRLTRPLRASRRIARNAIKRRVYNPVRWPRLIARLVHNLRLYGARGTLELMQQVDAAHPEPPASFEQPAKPSSQTPEPVRLETSARPTASIIIPVFNKVAYTDACLRSIAAETQGLPFEVIVVDDCSSDDTAEYLSKCEGLTAIQNETNSGFIRSCNAGAAIARGEYLVFLNNDTTVTRNWLIALLETFEHFPAAGIVGARLVYPDGSLQEAGGIVFSDGSGWNYGRDDQPERPDYSFACETDYVSGACLAIRRETFERAGAFDERYAPAYYEDTDLCFSVRELGHQVIYQPGCTIVHHEGVSSGTDEASGTKRFQAINREKFLERWGNALAKQPDPVPGPEAVDQVCRARHHRSRGRVLVIDAVTPEPDKDSGSMRMEAMLDIMREMHYRVSFMPENLAWVGRYTRNLQQRGIEVLFHPWVSSAEDWLREHGAELDLVLVSRHYVLEPLISAIRKHCPNARIVFDTVDLHFLREQRMAELTGDERARRMAENTRKAETGLIRRTDATLVVSPVEQELLEGMLPDSDIRVLSNIHHIHGRSRGWSERRDLLFVGGFQHPPNIDAAEWLMDAIMPRVRAELPEVRLHIIGSRMPENLRERRADGVVLHGYVEDLKPYLQGCRLSVAPLRYGAGVKGKVNQAMAWGLPVVATTCAAEGMYLKDGEDILVADNSDEFAAAIVRAYTDESLWLKLSDAGLTNVETHFSFDAARLAISEMLSSLSPND